MLQTDILETLQHLTPQELLEVIEVAVKLLPTQLSGEASAASPLSQTSALSLAAQALLSDYQSDAELTRFTVLDSEALRNF
jgi:hypothetical protein